MFTRKLVAATLLIVAAAACGGDDGITDPDTVEGTYVLKNAQIDGQTRSMPIVVYEEPGYRLEITYSDFVLSANGTFTNNARWKETEDGVVTTDQESYSGTYTANGSALSFVSPGGDSFTGIWNGRTLTLTMVDEGETMIAVYEK